MECHFPWRERELLQSSQSQVLQSPQSQSTIIQFTHSSSSNTKTWDAWYAMTFLIHKNILCVQVAGWCSPFVKFEISKPLQLELLQNHFRCTRYDLISGFERFICIKCVHITILNFSGPKVFYNLRGFKRLQNQKIWPSRYFSTIRLVLKSGFGNLNSISKSCTEHMLFYCRNGFYISQGFQKYKFHNFSTCGWFSMIFPSFSSNLPN